MDGAWGNTVTGLCGCPAKRLGGEAKAAVDEGDTGHDAPLAAEAVFQLDPPGADGAQQAAAFDGGALLLQAHIGGGQVAGAGELVARDLVLCDQNRAGTERLRERNGNRPANRVEECDLAVGKLGAANDVQHIDDDCTIVDLE